MRPGTIGSLSWAWAAGSRAGAAEDLGAGRWPRGAAGGGRRRGRRAGRRADRGPVRRGLQRRPRKRRSHGCRVRASVPREGANGDGRKRRKPCDTDDREAHAGARHHCHYIGQRGIGPQPGSPASAGNRPPLAKSGFGPRAPPIWYERGRTPLRAALAPPPAGWFRPRGRPAPCTHSGRPAVVCLLLLPAAVHAQYVETTADPATVQLRGPAAVYTLLVHGRTADGRLVDRTRDAHFRSLDPKVAAVSDAGVVRAVGDGQTTVVADIDGGMAGLPLALTGRRVGRGRDRPATLQLRERRGAGVEPVRLQLGGMPRQGGRPERLQAVRIRLRSCRRFRRPDERGPRPPRLPDGAGLQPRPPQDFRAHRPRRRRSASRPGSADYETLRAWIAAGARSACRATPKVDGGAAVESARSRVLAPRAAGSSSASSPPIPTAARPT